MPAKNGEITNRFPQVFRPEGEAFLFQSRTAEGTNVESTIQVQSIKTGRRKTLVRAVPTPAISRAATWSICIWGSHAAPMDLKRLQLTGPASPVLEDVRFNGNGYAHF